MKKIINGKMYNTETAKEIGSWNNGRYRSDFYYVGETLYKKKTGELFVFGEGGAASRYAEIARRMGLPGTSEKALINSLCAKIDEFNAKMNIPKTLKEFGINEDEFKEKLDKIAELAVGDACTGSNPRAIDPATMAKLFTCTYYGTEVDF